MSSGYDSSRARRRGVWSHWVPLVLTVTVATVGVAAWAWSQRNNDEEENETSTAGLDYDNADYGDNPPYGSTDAKSRGTLAHSSLSHVEGTSYHHGESGQGGWGTHMSGALRRTPSPQQFLSNAGKSVAAGVGAMGAAVGTALAAIREDYKTAYADHETWSQEAESRRGKALSTSKSRDANKRRKTVAVIVSADSSLYGLDDDGFHEHAVRESFAVKLF